MQTPLRQFDSDTRLVGFVTRQIKEVVRQEQTVLRHYTSCKTSLIHNIEWGHHGYADSASAWRMVKFYDQQIEECKDKIAAWLRLFQ